MNLPQPLTHHWWVLAIAAALVAITPLWRYTRYLCVYVHEAGHAVMAVLTGRKLNSITLHANGAGLTTSTGDHLSSVPTLAAGYPAPATAGLLLAASLNWQVPPTWTVIALAAIAFGIVVMMRNLTGLSLGLVVVAALTGAAWQLDPEAQRTVITGLCWFLVLAGLRHTLAQFTAYRHSEGHDAQALARVTHLPAVVWLLMFVFSTLVCCYFTWQWTLRA